MATTKKPSKSQLSQWAAGWKFQLYTKHSGKAKSLKPQKLYLSRLRDTAMPVCDRPESPEEPISETYSINRMEQDLYELVEEQQVLLEIMARERERLERHLEMRRVLLTEQPAVALTTPLPELFAPQLEEIQIVEKQPTTNKKPKLELPVVAVVAGTSKASPLPKCSEQPLPLPMPATPRPKTRFDQTRERPVARVAPMVRECKGAKCTPPKPNGLGYDPPFPYPKRLGKSRERRAQYIFTLCDELALQLKCYMEMSRSGQESSVIIRELGVKPAVLKSQKMICEEPIMAATTGALPKSKCQGLEKPVKRFPSKQSTISKHKTTSSWNIASIMEPEIDLDCELGMEHIEKFRYNNLREQQHNQMQASAAETESTDRMHIDNMKLALAMSELNIDEDEFAPPKQQEQITLTDWNNDEIFVPGSGSGSQPETCPSTPDIETCELLPACLLSNGCINTMPSTSAQARAMALAMLGETDSLDCSLENLTICNFSN